MGRHADPFDDSFRRSLWRAVGGGLLAMVVTFGITAVLTVVGRDDAEQAGPAMLSPTPDPEEATAAAPPTQEPEPARSDEPAPQPEPTDPTEPPDDPSAVTVQVLDTVGDGTGPDALEAAEVLRRLGYDVVAVFATRRTTDVTLVLATPGHRDEAEALRETDERFAEVGRNDGFSEEVDLHVLVAAGFAD
jgi:hypothetical protein